jgi:hypothetical protein
MLGWVQRHPKYSDVLMPTPIAAPALDAFEAQMAGYLDHPAFSDFGSVNVTADEARVWANAWSLDSVTKAEAATMAEMLFGAGAPPCRRAGGNLILAAVDYSSSTDVDRLRETMSGPPSNFAPTQDLQKISEDFRRLQVRQLFRFSLEALFYWTLAHLEGRPKGIDALVQAFLEELTPTGKENQTQEWLHAIFPSGAGPTELIKRIEFALNNPPANDLAPSIAAGLAFCLIEATHGETRFERPDRLPLSRAQQELANRADGPVDDFLRHVFESWILAQHVYWSVGRGLADARARGKTLLRLKAILDEGGWTLAPGASRGSPPSPTGDRLQTVVNLGEESELIQIEEA